MQQTAIRQLVAEAEFSSLVAALEIACKGPGQVVKTYPGFLSVGFSASAKTAVGSAKQ
jgi:hypothetical protein